MPRTLIADDQPDILEALRLLLKNEGHQTETASTPADVLEALQSGEFDLLLMDLNYARDTTSGKEGMDLVSRVRAINHNLPIVVMTAWGSVPLAVEALQKGVGDFVEKPWENARLLEVLRAQLEQARARREVMRQEDEAVQQLRQQEQEFDQARVIQQSFLPHDIPEVAGYDFSGAWRPARSVGGDYFDVLPLATARFGLAIADVMGKGVLAALLMSNLQAAVRASAGENTEPAELCARVNKQLCRNLANDRFVTFFYGVLHAEEKRLVYTNAGHNPPILLRFDGTAERLATGGAVMGMFPEGRYEQSEIRLESADRLVLFTDGISELRNAAGEEFGEERLVKLVRENKEKSAAQLGALIFAAGDEFGGKFQDDATLIVMAVN